MLHYQTIESGTLELLRKLMQTDEFKELRLVGGTSLALQIGHRSSIDIDMFGILDTDTAEDPRMLMSMNWEKVKDLITISMQKYITNL